MGTRSARRSSQNCTRGREGGGRASRPAALPRRSQPDEHPAQGGEEPPDRQDRGLRIVLRCGTARERRVLQPANDNWILRAGSLAATTSRERRCLLIGCRALYDAGGLSVGGKRR